MIHVEALSVRVPGFVLQDATFTVPTGGLAVMTGPTGAGKTTLLETIAGVRTAQRGVIKLGARDVRALPPEQRDVGLVYQAGWLFPHLSVQQNIAYGASTTRSVTDVVTALRIDLLRSRPLATLSGGERQLVAIARALVRAPQTLLLDEPFAAMDGALREQTRTVVLRWAMEHGMTTILVTHDADEARLAGAMSLRVANGTVSVG